MCREAALGIEAINAHALHRTPSHPAVALAHRRHAGAETDVLHAEVPVGKLRLLLWNHQQTLVLQAQPEIALAVEQHVQHLRRVQVDAVGSHLHALQAIGSIALRQLPQTAAARAQIECSCLVGSSYVEDDACTTTVRAGLCRDGAHVLAVVDHDAVLADDEHVAAGIYDAYHITHRRLERLLALSLCNGKRLVEAVFPHAPLTVHHQSAIVAVGFAHTIFMGICKHAVGAVAHVVAEGTVARCGNHDAAIPEAGDIDHTRFHRAWEPIVAEAVRRSVVVVESVVRAHP